MKKYIWLLSLLPISFIIIYLTMTGCTPKCQPSSTYVLMTGTEVGNFITYSNNIRSVGCALVPDISYAIPTEEWIEDQYTPYLKSFILKNKLVWSKDSENDCDKYSQYGVTVGHIMHYKAKGKPKETALSIGEFMYMPTATGHALNFFIATDKNKKLKLVFYEPQLQRIIELNPTNQAVLYWRM
jgi:hypothetical protein